MHADDRFIGRGWAFPLRLDPTGAVALVGREREIEEALWLILGTAPGERPMRPEFGCHVHDHVFATADATTAGILRAEVELAVTRWEPRVELIAVDVTPDDERQNLLWIDVRYRIRELNDPRNLVFPFYTIPSEE